MADKYTAVDPTTGRLKQVAATVVSTGASEAGDVVALDSSGKIDESLLPSSTGSAVQNLTFTETVVAGDWINIYNNSGTPAARKAVATDATKPAHGFVNAGVTSGNPGNIQLGGVNAFIPVSGYSASDVGKEVFLSDTTGGGTTKTPPSTSGHLLQGLGKIITIDGTYITVEFRLGLEVLL